jgi:hypothetical protein
MAWKNEYKVNGNFTDCEIELTNNSGGNYIEGGYIVIDNANVNNTNKLLTGADLSGFDPANDVLVLLIVQQHSTFDPTTNLKFTIRASACSVSNCANIFGVPYVYSSTPSLNGATQPTVKRSHPVSSNELGGGGTE